MLWRRGGGGCLVPCINYACSHGPVHTRPCGHGWEQFGNEGAIKSVEGIAENSKWYAIWRGGGGGGVILFYALTMLTVMVMVTPGYVSTVGSSLEMKEGAIKSVKRTAENSKWYVIWGRGKSWHILSCALIMLIVMTTQGYKYRPVVSSLENEGRRNKICRRNSWEFNVICYMKNGEKSWVLSYALIMLTLMVFVTQGYKYRPVVSSLGIPILIYQGALHESLLPPRNVMVVEPLQNSRWGTLDLIIKNWTIRGLRTGIHNGRADDFMQIDACCSSTSIKHCRELRRDLRYMSCKSEYQRRGWK